MKFNAERHWYQPEWSWVTFLLFPLSLLFKFIVTLRRFCYRKRLLKIHSFPVPVIVVGNITVGGTGKTPFVIWLAALLKSQGHSPGIVTRGVGGKQQREPRWVKENADVKLTGDEAILLAKRTECPVVIGIDRVAAVQELLAKTTCDVVISDDGLQHYRLGRDVEIAIIDAARGLGNGCLLPAGPLRESSDRLQEVDHVVYQVGVSDVRTGITMCLRGDDLVSLKTSQKISLSEWKGKTVHAVAAIGNPSRFFAALRLQGLVLIEHVFPDHYLYREKDFCFDDELPIVMTEKDAVKCGGFADERFWCLPVEGVVKGFKCNLI